MIYEDTLMLPSKSQVNWLSVQEEKRKIDIRDDRHGGHLGFPRNDFSYFALHVTLMLPTKSVDLSVQAKM